MINDTNEENFYSQILIKIASLIDSVV